MSDSEDDGGVAVARTARANSSPKKPGSLLTVSWREAELDMKRSRKERKAERDRMLGRVWNTFNAPGHYSGKPTLVPGAWVHKTAIAKSLSRSQSKEEWRDILGTGVDGLGRSFGDEGKGFHVGGNYFNHEVREEIQRLANTHDSFDAQGRFKKKYSQAKQVYGASPAVDGRWRGLGPEYEHITKSAEAQVAANPFAFIRRNYATRGAAQGAFDLQAAKNVKAVHSARRGRGAHSEDSAHDHVEAAPNMGDALLDATGAKRVMSGVRRPKTKHWVPSTKWDDNWAKSIPRKENGRFGTAPGLWPVSVPDNVALPSVQIKAVYDQHHKLRKKKSTRLMNDIYGKAPFVLGMTEADKQAIRDHRRVMQAEALVLADHRDLDGDGVVDVKQGDESSAQRQKHLVDETLTELGHQKLVIE